MRVQGDGRHRDGGWTLVEVLVVLAVMFTVLAVVSPFLSELSREGRALDDERRDGDGLAALVELLSRDLARATRVTSTGSPTAARLVLALPDTRATTVSYTLSRRAATRTAAGRSRRFPIGGSLAVLPEREPGRLGLRYQPVTGPPETILLRVGAPGAPVTPESAP